jgi:hypothetical protein
MEVTAESLYEAVARGLCALRMNPEKALSDPPCPHGGFRPMDRGSRHDGGGDHGPRASAGDSCRNRRAYRPVEATRWQEERNRQELKHALPRSIRVPGHGLWSGVSRATFRDLCLLATQQTANVANLVGSPLCELEVPHQYRLYPPHTSIFAAVSPCPPAPTSGLGKIRERALCDSKPRGARGSPYQATPPATHQPDSPQTRDARADNSPPQQPPASRWIPPRMSAGRAG